MRILGRIAARARKRGLGSRWRNIITGIAGLLFAKGVSFATLLVTVPLLLKHLGTERFGVWMTLTSLSAILVVSDFGIGNGIKSEIARAFGRNDSEMLRKAALNGVVTQLFLAISFIVMTLVANEFLDWATILNVHGNAARDEVNNAALIFLMCAFLAGPLSVGTRIRGGMQREDINGVWSSVGSVLSLIALIIGIRENFGLSALLLCFVGTPVVISAIATIVTFRQNKDLLMPAAGDLDIHEVARMFGQGLRYLGITIVFILTFSIDNIFIARTLGPEAVAVYSIADRLLQIISVVLTMVNAPFWPAYAAAHASGDHGWVLRTFRRAFVANLLFSCAGAVVLLTFAGPIYRVWIGHAIVPALPLLLAIAGRRVAEALYSACNVLLNSLDDLATQIGWGLAMAAAAVLFRLALLPYLGLNAIPVGVTLAVLCFGFVPAVFAVRRLRRSGAVVSK